MLKRVQHDKRNLMSDPTLFLLIFFAYLIGSIPFGLILTRASGLGDIRQVGSGNIGATNVLRTGNKKLAALTLLLDGLKGFFAVWLAHFWSQSDTVLLSVGLCALLGHLFPVWLKFKGGKGVATAIGVCFAIVWPVGVWIICVWLSVFAIYRISSLSALVAFTTAPAFFAWQHTDTMTGFPTMIWLLSIAAILLLTHSANIQRLVRGEEPKFGSKK